MDINLLSFEVEKWDLAKEIGISGYTTVDHRPYIEHIINRTDPPSNVYRLRLKCISVLKLDDPKKIILDYVSVSTHLVFVNDDKDQDIKLDTAIRNSYKRHVEEFFLKSKDVLVYNMSYDLRDEDVINIREEIKSLLERLAP